MTQFDSDNLIYNRFDLIHKDEYTEQSYVFAGENYKIDSFINGGVASLNVWGKKFPCDIFKKAVSDVFEYNAVHMIDITRCGNDYENFLEETNDIRIPLPNTVDELLARVERRDRATIRRKKRWLNERIGTLELKWYNRETIPDSLVDLYFLWKKETHGTNYGMSPQEYLNMYYVTDALYLVAGDIDVAVAFYCMCEDIAFFENFSYNQALKDYSPGLLMYELLLEELIGRKCRYLYMGGGSYIYKRRFGAEESVAYSGRIYSSAFLKEINVLLARENVRKIAIYGMGKVGHEFLRLRDKCEWDVVYAIDREEKSGEIITVLKSDSESFPPVDAVIITMNDRNETIESLAHAIAGNVYYWKEMEEEILAKLLKRSM